MKKINLQKNLLFCLGLYFIIFIVLPFILLKPLFLVKDIAWFIDYFIFVFPLTFFAFIWFITKNNISGKNVFLLWISFFAIYILLIFYNYNMVVTIINNSRFPF